VLSMGNLKNTYKETRTAGSVNEWGTNKRMRLDRPSFPRMSP
jgi:hypothetical protein